VADFVSNEEIVLAARRNLSQAAWDYLVGGSESETTMRRNRLAFDKVAFRPRVLMDVSKIDPSTDFLGHQLRMPVLLAPIGSLENFHPLGAVASVEAADQFGTLPVVSTVTEPSLEETAQSTKGAKIFQLYVHGDNAWVRDRLQRAVAAGYSAICLTVDVAVYSRRERPMMPRRVAAGHRAPAREFQAGMTWATVEMVKAETKGLPFLIKGIGTAEDAAIAVEHGVDVVWVSNHGGRQLDNARGSLDCLPEIVEAVGGKADIVVDGGVQRGSDVLKAVAMGAKAVAIGKLQGWGIAAAGTAGIVRVLEVLENELISAMGLLGVSDLSKLTPRHICGADPVTPPHEMSMWVNMPGGRII